MDVLQKDGRVLIQVSVNRAARPQTAPIWLMAAVIVVILGALWAGFISLRPWIPLNVIGRNHTGRVFGYLIALSGLLAIALRIELRRARDRAARWPLEDSREEIDLQGTTMQYRRGNSAVFRIDQRYDLAQASGLAVESSRIVFKYGGRLCAVAHLMTPDERQMAFGHIVEHSRCSGVPAESA